MSEFRRRLIMGAGKKELPNYLCFTAKEASTISKTGTYAASLEYSTDGSTWSTFDNNSTINLSTGDSVYFRGNNTRLGSGGSAYTNFVMTGSIEASGNIMSLLYKSGFDSKKTISQPYCFYRLFYNCTALKTPPELPATSITQHSYESMFEGCTSLTSAPQLSQVTSIGNGNNYSCTRMFYGCTSLITASIPSVTQGEGYCYKQMYYGCTSLTTAPDIPLTSWRSGYSNHCEAMFYGCINLTSVQKKLYCTGISGSMYKNMFYNCTKLETAPELPAGTASASYCYQQMFIGCSKLSWIKMLAVTVGSNALGNWVKNVASTGIFVKHIDATWTTTGNNGVPTNWTVIYYDPSEDKYYTDQTKTTECDDHGNPL